MRASSTLVTVLAMGALAATGCGKVPGMGGKSKVDPNSCGNYAVSDAGRKLHGFLEATVALAVAANKVESVVKESCVIMGHELKMAESDLSGSTDAVCNKVIENLKAGMSASFKADAKLDIQYKPAVCTVNADVAARAAAQCEAKAEADIGVTCSGTCNGTCDGQCSGLVDASIITTHLMLQAAELGLGTTWVGSFDPTKAAKALDLPANIVPVAILPLGYPAADAAPAAMHTSRKDLAETVTWL